MDRTRCLVVLSLLFVSTVYGQNTPEITEIIKPEYKPAGGTAYLNCTVQFVSGQTNSVTWAHIRPGGVMRISKDDGIVADFNPIVNAGEEKYDVLVTNVLGSTNKKVYHLVVRSLVAEDSGTYLCEVRITGTFDFPSSQGQLFVQVPPIIKPQSTTSVSAREGNDVKLECVAEGSPHPNMTWITLNSEGLPANRHTITNREEGVLSYSILTIQKIRTKDRGSYRCLADNSVRPPGQLDVMLTVEFKPSAQATIPAVGSPAGEQIQATLQCLLSGSPDPSVEWLLVHKASEPAPADRQAWKMLYAGSKYSMAQRKGLQGMTLDQTYHSLTIRTVGAGDFGNYSCQGRNRMGVSGQFILLYESDKIDGGGNFDPIIDSSSKPVPSLYVSVVLLSLSQLIVFLS